MILIDTGPVVAAFRRSEKSHDDCRKKLKTLAQPFVSTLPVLTEAFHLLAPASGGADDLRAMVSEGLIKIRTPDAAEIARAFALMETYRDLPMDFADASIIAAAEALKTRKVFTFDARDFAVYRIRRGHRLYPVDLA